MTRWPVLAAAITALSLAGCGSDPAVPDQLAPPAAPPAETAAAETPAAGTPATADPGAPDPADAAAEAPTPEPAGPISNAADARAVEQLVRDYYAAINRAQYEGDIAGLEALTTSDCNCRKVSGHIASLVADGMIYESAWHVRSIDVQNVNSASASVSADVAVSDGRVVLNDGSERLIENQGGGTLVHALLRTPTGWVIAQVLRT